MGRKILTIDVSRPLEEIATDLLTAAEDVGFFYVSGTAWLHLLMAGPDERRICDRLISIMLCRTWHPRRRAGEGPQGRPGVPRPPVKGDLDRRVLAAHCPRMLSRSPHGFLVSVAGQGTVPIQPR